MMNFEHLSHIVEYTPVIRYEPRSKTFFFTHSQCSPKQIGAMLAHALLSGMSEVLLPFVRNSAGGWTSSYSVAVSTRYIEQMLKFVARHGWFWDEVEEHESRRNSDHTFDRNQITPGFYWQEVSQLLTQAKATAESAGRHAERGEDQMAIQLKAIEADLKTAAVRLIKLSVPDYRSVRRRMRQERRRRHA